MDKECIMKNMIPSNTDRSPVHRFGGYFGNSLYPFHFGMGPGNNGGRPVNADQSPVNDKRPDDSATPEHCFRLEYLPEAAEAKLVDYRGQKMAAFVVDGETMICLPQAYEIFLKHLVGGLHTVYTKLKRLEITPFVCNVEQVRALRSIGAIQPGVNRCKLIACRDFDVLYDDCASSNSKPGRPPKRCTLYGQGIFGHETPTHDAKKPKFSNFLQRNARPMKFENDFNGGGSLSTAQTMQSAAPIIMGGSSSSGERTPLQPAAASAALSAAAANGAQSSTPIFPFYNLQTPHHFFMSQLPFMAKQWSDYGMNAFKQCLENYGGQQQRMTSPAMTMSGGNGGETPAATPDGADAPPQLAPRGPVFPFFASQWNNFSISADDDKKGDGCNEGEDGRENETNLGSNEQKNDDKESPKSMDSDSSDAAVNLTVNNHHSSSSSSSSGCQFSSSLEHKSTSSPLSSSSLSSSFGGDNSESQSMQKSSSDNKLSDENDNDKKSSSSSSTSTKNEERQRKTSSQKRQSSKDRVNSNNNNNMSQSSKKTIFPIPIGHQQLDLSNKSRSYVNFFLDNNNNKSNDRAASATTPAAGVIGDPAPFSSVQKLLFDVIRLMEMAAVTSQKQEEQFFKEKVELSNAYEEEKREKNKIENLLDEEKRAKTVYQKRWRQTMKKYKTLRERHSAAQTTNNGSSGNSSEETNNDTLKMGADSSSMATEMMEEAAAAAAAAATNETLCGGGGSVTGLTAASGNSAASRSSGYNSSSVKSPSYSCSSASLKMKDGGASSPPDGRGCESWGNCSSSDSSSNAAAVNAGGKVQHRVHYRNHHHHHRHNHPYEHIKRTGQFASGAYSSSSTSLSSATSSKAPLSSPGSSHEKSRCQKLRGKNIQTIENKEKLLKENNNNVVVDFSIRSGSGSHHSSSKTSPVLAATATPIAQEPLPMTKIEVEKMEVN